MKFIYDEYTYESRYVHACICMYTYPHPRIYVYIYICSTVQGTEKGFILKWMGEGVFVCLFV